MDSPAPHPSDPALAPAESDHSERLVVEGKFFRQGNRKVYVKGVTYGPFAPGLHQDHFPEFEQAAKDFQRMRQMGANVARVYYTPPDRILDAAARHGMRLMVDVPWPKHLCFLDSPALRASARREVRAAARAVRGHPALFALSVVNEVAPDMARWSGVDRVGRFIDELILEVKSEDDGALCTFTSYPPTEYLRAERVDFCTFNVYLHERAALTAYLARLQTLAGARPLVLGEFGMDTIREGEARQAEFLSWQIETAFQAGVAGTVVFSFTDDWHRGGHRIEDWAFGVTDAARRPKPGFEAVRAQYDRAPHSPLPATPKVSVVVASYNGGKTLGACLESLRRLNYPDYEVILVDDGSTDDTPAIAARFPEVRCVRQANLGLSAARNAGIAAARGSLVAFTDSDCRADPDWLHYLAGDLIREGWVGVGGPNFLPADDSPVAAAVMASPGGPAQVLITDREAEHIPGCNMVFQKNALESAGGFDPVFRKAGDDVDLCWRLLQSGGKIGFHAGGFVWHYRRSTVGAYLRQQAGYGEAEALLARKHPEYFNLTGGGIWRGRIYGLGNDGILLHRPVIYHGIFGSGFFQRMYSSDPVLPLLLCTSLGYHAGINVPLLLLAIYWPLLWPLAIVSVSLSFATCLIAAWQAPLAHDRRRFWSRPLVALLFALQPVARGWARLAVRWNLRTAGHPSDFRSRPLAGLPADKRAAAEPRRAYWALQGLERFEFLHRTAAALKELGWPLRLDSGWSAYDLETSPGRWCRLRLASVVEELDEGKRVLRCRVQSAWSARSWLAFAVATAAAGTIVAWGAEGRPWLWTAMILVPLALWWLDDETLFWEETLGRVLDGVAERSSMVRVDTRD